MGHINSPAPGRPTSMDASNLTIKSTAVNHPLLHDHTDCCNATPLKLDRASSASSVWLWGCFSPRTADDMAYASPDTDTPTAKARRPSALSNIFRTTSLSLLLKSHTAPSSPSKSSSSHQMPCSGSPAKQAAYGAAGLVPSTSFATASPHQAAIVKTLSGQPLPATDIDPTKAGLSPLGHRASITRDAVQDIWQAPPSSPLTGRPAHNRLGTPLSIIVDDNFMMPGPSSPDATKLANELTDALQLLTSPSYNKDLVNSFLPQRSTNCGDKSICSEYSEFSVTSPWSGVDRSQTGLSDTSLTGPDMSLSPTSQRLNTSPRKPAGVARTCSIAAELKLGRKA